MMKQRFHNLFSPIPRRRGRMLPAIALAAVLCLGGAGVLFLRTPDHAAPGTHRPPSSAPSPIHGPPWHAHQRRPAHHALLSLPHRHRRRLRCARRTDDPPGGRAAPETRGRCADRGQHRQPLPSYPARIGPAFPGGNPPAIRCQHRPRQFAQANLGTVGADTPCYLTPEDTSAVSVFSDPCLVSVSSRAGGWAKVQAPGGGAPVWVRSQDLSYDFTWTGRTVDLSQLTV